MSVVPRGLTALRPGEHLCLIYEEPAERVQAACAFLRDGLARGESCLYAVDDERLPAAAEALSDAGLDVERERARGALVVLTHDEYAGAGPVKPVRLLDRLRQAASRALARGFTGLRVAAEMTWAIRRGVAPEELVEHESLANVTFFPHTPCTVLCMYRRSQFDTVMLRDVLQTHPDVLAADQVYVALCPLFQHLTTQALHAVLASARERRVEKGQFYFREGDTAAAVHVLVRGRVKLIQSGPDGRQVLLRFVSPMEPFGFLAALAGTDHLVAAQAMQDSRALTWDLATMGRLMQAHMPITLNGFRLVAEQSQEAWDRLRDLATERVERRIARALLRLARPHGRPDARTRALDLALTQQDLAEMAGTTPYTVSRVLGRWKRLGVVNARRERVLIRRPARLAAMAEDALVPAASSVKRP